MPPRKPLTLEEFARMGGKARAAKLSAQRRRAIAIKAGKASAAARADCAHARSRSKAGKTYCRDCRRRLT